MAASIVASTCSIIFGFVLDMWTSVFNVLRHLEFFPGIFVTRVRYIVMITNDKTSVA